MPMPYMLSKGPIMSVLESIANGTTAAEVTAAAEPDRLRNKVPITSLPAFASTNLAAGPGVDPLVARIDEYWFGHPELPGGALGPKQLAFDPANPKPTGYWKGYYGDVEGLIRETMIRAVEVSRGLANGQDLAQATRLWPVEVFWACPHPWVEGWVTWREHETVTKNGKTTSKGQVTVIFATPSDTVNQIATDPMTPPDPPTPTLAQSPGARRRACGSSPSRTTSPTSCTSWSTSQRARRSTQSSTVWPCSSAVRPSSGPSLCRPRCGKASGRSSRSSSPERTEAPSPAASASSEGANPMTVPENPEELRALVEDDVRAIFGEAFPGELTVPPRSTSAAHRHRRGHLGPVAVERRPQGLLPRSAADRAAGRVRRHHGAGDEGGRPAVPSAGRLRSNSIDRSMRSAVLDAPSSTASTADRSCGRRVPPA